MTISAQENNCQPKHDNRRTKSTLHSYQDARGDKGKTLSNPAVNKVNNNRSKLPPRPPRTSSSLPPPVPKKQRDITDNKRSNSLTKRAVLPPASRPISTRALPLQIQSPSIVQALRAVNNIENKSRVPVNLKQNLNTNPSTSKKTCDEAETRSSKNVGKNGVAGKSNLKIPPKPAASQRDVIKQKEATKGLRTTRNVSNKVIGTPTANKKVTLNSNLNNDKPKSRVATESLASRAKRTTEDKVKQIYNSFKGGKQDPTQSFTERRNNLQRKEMIISADNSDFPKKPVQSLIKLYDKSKVKTVHSKFEEFNQPPNCKIPMKQNPTSHRLPATKINHRNVDVVNNNKAHVGQKSIPNDLNVLPKSRASSHESGKHLTKTNKETKETSSKPNSIDEFLQSAKRTRQKYQDMLNHKADDKKSDSDSLEVKTDPSESDLQTGCFTDVSYAGYFAKPSEHHQKLNDISIIGNTSNLEEDQHNLCKQPSVDQEAPTGDIDQHMVHQDTNKGNLSHKDEGNKKPTPSPRMKKKQRREQFLQEHKQQGKMVLALAKNTFEHEKSSIEPQVEKILLLNHIKFF